MRDELDADKVRKNCLVRITDKWEPVIGKMIRIDKDKIAVLIPSKHEAI